MPIEEVLLNNNDNVTLAFKILDREEYWIKELCTIYPYGFNENIRKLGNISKLPNIVEYALFNKYYRKYRKRNGKRNKNKTYNEQIVYRMRELLLS